MPSNRLTITFTHLSSLEVAFRAKQIISGALTFSKNGNITRHHEITKTAGYSGSLTSLVIHRCFPTNIYLVLKSYSQ